LWTKPSTHLPILYIYIICTCVDTYSITYTYTYSLGYYAQYFQMFYLWKCDKSHIIIFLLDMPSFTKSKKSHNNKCLCLNIQNNICILFTCFLWYSQ
jgi:hypothetical protein